MHLLTCRSSSSLEEMHQHICGGREADEERNEINHLTGQSSEKEEGGKAGQMTKRVRCSRRLLLRSVIYSAVGGWVCQYPLLTVLSSRKYCGPHQHISQPPPSVAPGAAIQSFTPTCDAKIHLLRSIIVFFEVQSIEICNQLMLEFFGKQNSSLCKKKKADFDYYMACLKKYNSFCSNAVEETFLVTPPSPHPPPYSYTFSRQNHVIFISISFIMISSWNQY